MLTAPIVFRMRGDYFAIGAWMLAEVFRMAAPDISALGGGAGQSLTVMAAAAIFIAVIGGIGTIEGVIAGAAVFFALRWFLADYGSVYWLVMGAVAVVVIMFSPSGLWGFVRARWDLQLLPLQRCLILSGAGAAERGPGEAGIGSSREQPGIDQDSL